MKENSDVTGIEQFIVYFVAGTSIVLRRNADSIVKMLCKLMSVDQDVDTIIVNTFALLHSKADDPAVCVVFIANDGVFIPGIQAMIPFPPAMIDFVELIAADESTLIDQTIVRQMGVELEEDDGYPNGSDEQGQFIRQSHDLNYGYL